MVSIFLAPFAHTAEGDAVFAAPLGSQPLPQVEDRRFPLLPFRGQGELFDIPPGYERPVEVDEGELIPVKRFVLSGIDSNPDLAEYEAELMAILLAEKERAEKSNLTLARDEFGSDEFGSDEFGSDEFDSDEDSEELASDEGSEELESSASDASEGDGEVADADEFASDETDETDAEQTPAPKTVMSANVVSGMTIGQIQQAANLAAAYLREEGYFLVQGVLPEQTVIDGEVNILFLPGILGEVRVENNRWYSDSQLTDLYEDMIGSPVNRRRLERGILGMQKMPGLKSYATLVRGRSMGETDLLIRTQEEDRHDFALSVNNNNLADTGRYQFQFDYSLNNPFGISDIFSISTRSTVAPANNQFLSLSYDLPTSDTTGFFFNLYGVRYTIDASPSEGRTTDTEGSTLNFTTRFQYQIVRSRYYNLYLSGILDLVRLSTESGNGSLQQESTLSTFSASISMDWIEIRGNSLNTLDFTYSLGLPGFLGADEVLAENVSSAGRLTGDADFSYYTISYQRLQALNTNNSFLFKLRYQASDDSLYSIHNAVVGGSDSFRALPSSSLLRETSLLGTIEYILAPFSSRRFNDSLTISQVLQFSIFVDHVIALRTRAGTSTPGDPNGASLTGVGFSAQFNVPDLVKVRFDYAFLVRNSATPGREIGGVASEIISEYVYGTSSADQSRSRFYFELAWYF